jgi:hypothetical protein
MNLEAVPNKINLDRNASSGSSALTLLETKINVHIHVQKGV